MVNKGKDHRKLLSVNVNIISSVYKTKYIAYWQAEVSMREPLQNRFPNFREFLGIHDPCKPHKSLSLPLLFSLHCLTDTNVICIQIEFFRVISATLMHQTKKIPAILAPVWKIQRVLNVSVTFWIIAINGRIVVALLNYLKF